MERPDPPPGPICCPDWLEQLERTPPDVRREIERLQRLVTRLEQEIAFWRRKDDPTAGAVPPPPGPADTPVDGRTADWPQLLARTPPEIRQELERLQGLVSRQGPAVPTQGLGERLPRSLRAPPPPIPLPKAPAEQVAALCRRFRIASLKTFGEGWEGNPEDQACIVFVSLEPGVDQESIDCLDLEMELGRLFERTVDLRFL
ncbi:MAG: hypothetical protein GX442_20700 [Candidatus Riflebacteria bacterium]|nr:hypothetical protein [Candidatus Riflebacteria bacterium]